MHALTLPAAEMAAAKSEFERFFFERYIAGFVAFARGSDASALDLSQFYNIPISAEANRMFKVMHERFLRPSDFADLVVLDKRLDVLNTNYATVQVFWQFVDSKGKEFFREAVVYTIQRLPQGLRVTAICPAFPTREARTVEEAWKSAGALFDEKAKL
ncbi:hypothetical protein DFJ74DRAFT_708190 [Hyaloraphidium curvatum]|nr:hypothetical protein DFJ74DRAFT_708190 [Hyaloraphidium curvatum]